MSESEIEAFSNIRSGRSHVFIEGTGEVTNYQGKLVITTMTKTKEQIPYNQPLKNSIAEEENT